MTIIDFDPDRAFSPADSKRLKKAAARKRMTVSEYVEFALKRSLYGDAEPEKDPVAGRIARLRAVGAALGLGPEEVERDIVAPSLAEMATEPSWAPFMTGPEGETPEELSERRMKALRARFPDTEEVPLLQAIRFLKRFQ